MIIVLWLKFGNNFVKMFKLLDELLSLFFVIPIINSFCEELCNECYNYVIRFVNNLFS